MPLIHKTTVRARVWKQHTCSACGGLYRYKFTRSGEGQGGLAELARGEAERELDQSLRHDIEVHPCPTCGLVQPDMVAQGKARWHGLAALAALPALLLLGGYHVLPTDLAAMIAAGGLAV